MDRRSPWIPFDTHRFSPFFGKQVDPLEVTPLSGGASNSNYRVRSANSETWVCRIHSRGDARVERHVMGLVKDLVPTPEYVWMGDGVSVMPYIEGAHFQPTPSLMKQAGRLIGRLSQISLARSGLILADGSIRPFPGWSSFSDMLASFLKRPSVGEYLSESLLVELRELVVQKRPLWDDFDRSHNLVHGDFSPGNILTSGDSIVGVLDWEFAHSGSSYMDIANLMRNLSSDWGHHLAAGLREEGMPLPDDWLASTRLMDLASHLEFLTSLRSHEFKITRVNRIKQLLQTHGAIK